MSDIPTDNNGYPTTAAQWVKAVGVELFLLGLLITGFIGWSIKTHQMLGAQ